MIAGADTCPGYLARLPRSLGVPIRQVPSTLGAVPIVDLRRRLLVVLDNVSEDYPTEPLLPASSRAAVPLLRCLALKRAFFSRFPHVFISHHLRVRL